jgi:hypothetical protein
VELDVDVGILDPIGTVEAVGHLGQSVRQDGADVQPVADAAPPLPTGRRTATSRETVANASRDGSARQRTTKRQLRSPTGPAARTSPNGQRTDRNVSKFERATAKPSWNSSPQSSTSCSTPSRIAPLARSYGPPDSGSVSPRPPTSLAHQRPHLAAEMFARLQQPNDHCKVLITP